MGGGVLSNIFKKLTSTYGDDAARNIIGQYGDDITKRGSNSFLNRVVEGKADDIPTMVSYHGIPSDTLKLAADTMDGRLVNPSIQNVDPTKNMGGNFGEIVLLGNKNLTNPRMPDVAAFNRDVYTPRFPQIDDEGMIAMTNQLATPEAVSRHMNKQGMQGAEEFFDNMELAPGVIAAKNAKPLKSLRDIVENQGNITDYQTAHRAIGNRENELFDMVDDIYNSNNHNVDWDTVTSDVNSLLNNRRGYAPTIPQADVQRVMDFKKGYADMPTDYFETKVTRPVKLNEFSGAILPDDMVDPEILAILEKNNIPVMSRYNPAAKINDGNQNSSLQERLKELAKGDRFVKPYLLGTAGILPTAGILSSLFSGGSNQEQA